MKFVLTCLLASAAVCLIGACDSHPWEQTKGLHEPYQHHEHAEGASAEGAHASAAEETHGENK